MRIVPIISLRNTSYNWDKIEKISMAREGWNPISRSLSAYDFAKHSAPRYFPSKYRLILS